MQENHTSKPVADNKQGSESKQSSGASNKWARTWAYRKSKKMVVSLLQSPKRLLSLLEKVSQKSQKQALGPIGKTLESIKVMVRLVAAYAKGEYRDIALDKLAMIVAALVYFVMPLDALPDFIAIFGLSDDAALLAWTFSAVKEEAEKFLLWEHQQASNPIEEIEPEQEK